MQCEGDPCAGAVCPSHSEAECRGNYCGGCRAEWFIGATPVQCSGKEGTAANKIYLLGFELEV